MKHLFRILVFMALISLTGCYMGSEYYFKTKYLSTVRDIELIYYENEHPRRMVASEEELQLSIMNNFIVLKSLIIL